jgi:hypothetical protein
MQISFIWHTLSAVLRAVGQKSERLSLSQQAEWPNNEMRRGAVFGNRSFSPADAAVGIEFDKLTSGDLGLSPAFWLCGKKRFILRPRMYIYSHTK